MQARRRVWGDVSGFCHLFTVQRPGGVRVDVGGQRWVFDRGVELLVV